MVESIFTKKPYSIPEKPTSSQGFSSATEGVYSAGVSTPPKITVAKRSSSRRSFKEYSSEGVADRLIPTKIEEEPFPSKDIIKVTSGSGQVQRFQVTTREAPSEVVRERTRVGKVFNYIGESYRSVKRDVIDRPFQEYVLVPLINLESKYPKFFSRTTKESKVLFQKDLGFTGRVIQGARDEIVYKPSSVVEAYFGGKIVGKVLSTPKGTAFITSRAGKTASAGLVGAYGVGVTKGFIQAEDKGRFVGKEAVSLAAFTSGARLGFKPSPKGISQKDVKTVEFFKTTTKAKEFEGNILDVYRGKPTVFSGGQKTSGGGLFEVGGRQYRVLFKERGLIKDVGSGKVMRSTSVLDVQPYKYMVKLKPTPSYSQVPSGLLRKAYIQSTQVSVPTGDKVLVKSISKIKTKSTPTITRLSKAEVIPQTSSSTLKGVSIDTFRGKKIKGSEKFFKGTSEEVALTEVGGVRYSILTGKIFGRSVKPKGLDSNIVKDVQSNVKSFRKREFTSGANNLLSQTVSQTKPKPVSLVGEADLKQIVSLQYSKDVSMSAIKTAPKLSVGFKPSLPIQSQSVETVAKTKSFTPISSIVSRTKVKPSVVPVSSFKSFTSLKSVPVLKTKPFSRVTPDVVPKQIVEPKTELKQLQGLKQLQVLKQSLVQRLRVPTFFRGPSVVVPPKVPVFSDFKFKQKPSKSVGLKVSLKPVKYQYTPTVEGSLFKIKRFKQSRKLIESGLVVRGI